jgi:hypothetical protein
MRMLVGRAGLLHSAARQAGALEGCLITGTRHPAGIRHAHRGRSRQVGMHAATKGTTSKDQAMLIQPHNETPPTATKGDAAAATALGWLLALRTPPGPGAPGKGATSTIAGLQCAHPARGSPRRWRAPGACWAAPEAAAAPAAASPAAPHPARHAAHQREQRRGPPPPGPSPPCLLAGLQPHAAPAPDHSAAARAAGA